MVGKTSVDFGVIVSELRLLCYTHSAFIGSRHQPLRKVYKTLSVHLFVCANVSVTDQLCDAPPNRALFVL